MDRFLGLDAHMSSCTVAVVVPNGKRLSHQVVDPNAQALVAAARAMQPLFTGTFPDFVALHCAGDGGTWLRRFEIDASAESGSLWLRVDEGMLGAGQLGAREYREIRMPARFQPFHFTPDRVWGILLDGFDVPWVAWLAMPVG